eukprot:m.36212 g.36212  ORF g.36212 m.36212 type:complete len:275 (-) comp9648_c0_seq1:28-852(-)
MADRMRASGPETSVAPPRPELEVNASTGRVDKRKPSEQRPIYISVGLVSQARGSAYVEFGNTKLVAACYGPRDTLKMREYSSRGKISVEIKFAPFSGPRRRGYVQDGEEKELAELIEQALSAAVRLDRYPKSSIDVFVTVLEDDGGVFGGSITCASAALAAGGIEMHDLVAGCQVAVTKSAIIVDPSRPELAAATAQATLACMCSLSEVCALLQEGPVVAAMQGELVQAAVAGCSQAYLAQQHALVGSAHRKLRVAEREAALVAAAGEKMEVSA